MVRNMLCLFCGVWNKVIPAHDSKNCAGVCDKTLCQMEAVAFGMDKKDVAEGALLEGMWS